MTISWKFVASAAAADSVAAQSGAVVQAAVAAEHGNQADAAVAVVAAALVGVAAEKQLHRHCQFVGTPCCMQQVLNRLLLQLETTIA